MAQAEEVRAALGRAHGVDIEEIAIKAISTAGDRSQGSNRSLADIGGKGLFSKEIEDQLLDGRIDLAVHSSKDMATRLPNGLVLDVFLQREDVRDAFISLTAHTLDDLQEGAVIGTSSLRRRAQLLKARPDLKMVEFRGNLGTRLEKLEKGIAQATLLAAAGLNRLGQADRAATLLDPVVFPPAPAQGAIGIEVRQADERVRALVAPLNHQPSRQAVIAERAMLEVLDGSCRTPIGVYTRRVDNSLFMRGEVLSPDGQEVFLAELDGPAADAEPLGKALGEALLGQAGVAFMDRLRQAG